MAYLRLQPPRSACRPFPPCRLASEAWQDTCEMIRFSVDSGQNCAIIYAGKADIFPFELYKVYYLSTPYNAFGAGKALMDARSIR
jgi:hypothetical protein